MGCVENMGLATAFKNTVNGRSYFEVHHRAPGSKIMHILSLKANHPDDAAQWLQDMRQQQQVTMRRIVNVVLPAQCALIMSHIYVSVWQPAEQKSCKSVWPLNKS